MNNIDTRSPFFPRSKSAKQPFIDQTGALKRNSYDRVKELENKTSKDAKVTIPESIKDFSRIKKTADAAVPVDNTEKIAMLKAKIQDGTYDIDYDAVADKMLETEY